MSGNRLFRVDRNLVRSRHLRPVRSAWLSGRIWRRRAILLGGAAVIGLAAVAFADLADRASALYRAMVTAWPLAPLLVTPVGFAISAVLARAFFDGSQGSGIPQVIAARGSPDVVHRGRLLSSRVTIGKVVLVLFGLAVGASIGREGPTVQVGAAISFAIGGVAGIGRQRGLVLAGAAAGIAAAFNTPLAGIMFAIEELAKSFERRMAAITAACVVVAGLTSLAILGNYSYFGQVQIELPNLSDWLAVPLAAAMGGLFGGLFSRGVLAWSTRPPRLARGRANVAVFAFVCGAVVAVLALLTNGYAAGTSYAETRSLLETGAQVPLWYAPAKLLSTLLSSVGGLPGGLFSPSLSVGAGLSALIAPILSGTDPRTIATLTMVAYFAGVVQSPLTAFVIVIEMTHSEGRSIPILATSLLAAGLSRLVCREPLYHALSRAWLAPRPKRPTPKVTWEDPIS